MIRVRNKIGVMETIDGNRAYKLLDNGGFALCNVLSLKLYWNIINHRIYNMFTIAEMVDDNNPISVTEGIFIDPPDGLNI